MNQSDGGSYCTGDRSQFIFCTGSQGHNLIVYSSYGNNDIMKMYLCRGGVKNKPKRGRHLFGFVPVDGDDDLGDDQGCS